MKKDADKTVGSTLYGKTTQTINFDKIVLDRLKQKAKESNSKVSNIVNSIVRRVIMTDAGWHRHMAKEHMMKFHEHKYLADELLVQVEQ